MAHTKEFRFDGWTLRCDSGDLVGEGRTVRLRKQSQQVLEALLEYPGEVVMREQLIARLWPRGVVDFEMGLNSAIGRLRRTLDDDADAPRYIETLPRRGYRFIGHVTVACEDGSVAQAPIAEQTFPQRMHRARDRIFLAALCTVALAIAGSAPAPTRWLPLALQDAPAASMQDAAADEHYRLGRYFLARRNAGDLERARERFESAAAIDPGFAQAYAGLASTDWLLAVEGLAPEDAVLPQMRTAANRALALDPDLAEAHMRLALDALRIGRHDLYEMHATRAERAQPDNALLLSESSSEALSNGHFDEGVALARRAVAAEPLTIAYRYNLASALFLAGRYDEAKQVNLDVLALDPSTWADIAGQVLVLQRRFEEALALAKTWPDGIDKYEIEALAYQGLRRRGEADAALAALIGTAGDRDPLRIVEVYAYRGDADAAFGWLAISAGWFRRNQTLPSHELLPWTLRLSPFVASLRDSPRWPEFVAKLGDI
ncbi:MAG TPA: winged helix-turn-helix domain-containing protein [Rhodanobacteraceae bacterium]|nr:winged helix-turn-helix domain-containing protein [Rhodanobacteraceae bacterium]